MPVAADLLNFIILARTYVIRLPVSSTLLHHATVHLFTDERISLGFEPIQLGRRMPLMLSPALVIKAAFERAPASTVAPPRRRSAENGRGRQNGSVLKVESSNR